MNLKTMMRHVRVAAGGHWLWTGAIQQSTGYGMVRYPTSRSAPITAHRAFKLAGGESVRRGDDVHHIGLYDCPKHCVNPEHTEVLPADTHRALHGAEASDAAFFGWKFWT